MCGHQRAGTEKPGTQPLPGFLLLGYSHSPRHLRPHRLVA